MALGDFLGPLPSSEGPCDALALSFCVCVQRTTRMDGEDSHWIAEEPIVSQPRQLGLLGFINAIMNRPHASNS